MTPLPDPIRVTLTIRTVYRYESAYLNLPPTADGMEMYLIKPRRKSWIVGYFCNTEDGWCVESQFNPLLTAGESRTHYLPITPGDQWAPLPEGMVP